MKVTNVNFYPVQKDGNILGLADIVLDEELVIKGVRLLSGKYGAFLGFPSRKGKDDKYTDIVFPTSKDLRKEMLDCVLKESGYTGDQKGHGEKSNDDDPFAD